MDCFYQLIVVSDVEEKKKDVIRKTDAESIRLAKTLVRSARHGAIAFLDPNTGAPSINRVGVATDLDGTPLILVSMLSAHTPAILADPRCSLLVGVTGKGDPLAHPRISLSCRAVRLERGSPDHVRTERRYLNHNPKAKLYAGLGDFSIFRLEPETGSLNAGFGKAVEEAVERQLKALPRVETASASWRDFGAVILVDDFDAALPLVDRIAAEHVELAIGDAEGFLARMRNAGAVFLGRHTPEAIGDYVGGSNHVLPTARSARFSSGLSVLDFVKRTSILKLGPDQLKALAPAAIALATAEGLDAHGRSVAIRLNM